MPALDKPSKIYDMDYNRLTEGWGPEKYSLISERNPSNLRSVLALIEAHRVSTVHKICRSMPFEPMTSFVHAT
jgi:hypothetical protein